tara:strand:- start:325 stop:936 length:612 start_codon:yes stop_codon:yes gene_type:complete
MKKTFYLFITLFLSFIFSCTNSSNDKNPTIDFNDKGQVENVSNKAIIKVIDEKYATISDETMLYMLFDATEIMNMSDEEQKRVIADKKGTTTVYIKSENTEENIIIHKTEPVPLNKMLRYFRANAEQMLKEYFSNTGYSFEIIESQKNIYAGKYDYISFKTLLNGPDIRRYSSQYVFILNKEYYHIVINTYNDVNLNDLISIE